MIRVDVTESKRREAELAAAQDRYRMLFDANAYPMVVIDRQSRDILAVNDAAVAQYGWSREEALSMTSDDFYPPEDLAKVAEMRQRDETRVGLGTITGLHHRTRDGSIIDVELSASKIELGGRPALLTTIQNVTERNRAEKARLAVAEQLRQSQKMEAVGQLTGGIAHDFNNILTVILANADALQEEESLDAAVAGRLDQIAQAVERASGLTRQLLAFSRKQPLSPQAHRHQRPGDDHRQAAAPRAGRTGRDRDPRSPTACGPSTSTAPSSRPRWSTSASTPATPCRAAASSDRDVQRHARRGLRRRQPRRRRRRLCDAVRHRHRHRHPAGDAGQGLRAVLHHQGASARAPVLGLSMVYGFIKQSNGHIAIDSEVGRGTTFKLYLPRSVGEEGGGNGLPARRRSRVAASASWWSRTTPQVRASVVRQLQRLGYTVSQAPDGAVGVAAFEAATQPYDLLLTDVIMPGPLNGKALADEVARRWPKTQVLFMSGYSEDVITHHGRLDAGVRLLSKPFRMTDLATTIREAFDEQGGSGKPSRAVQQAA